MSTKPENRHEFEAQLIAKAWKDEAFRRQLVSNPKAVITSESGKEFPENIEVRVLEETPNTRYIIIPNAPSNMNVEDLSDAALEAVAGGAPQANFLDVSFVACG